MLEQHQSADGGFAGMGEATSTVWGSGIQRGKNSRVIATDRSHTGLKMESDVRFTPGTRNPMSAICGGVLPGDVWTVAVEATGKTEWILVI